MLSFYFVLYVPYEPVIAELLVPDRVCVDHE